MDHKESNENCKTLNPCASVKKVELKDDAHLKKYIMWENQRNNCWLDASMALMAHNRVMKKYCQVSPASKISKIISEYDEAISLLNDPEKTFKHRLDLAKVKLNFIQESTLAYLKPILKYEIGHPESAFCCLYNLLIQDPDIKSIFDVTWLSVKECTNCGDCTVRTKEKPIITLSKIDSFNPENPLVLYNCACNKSVQKIKLEYVRLPPCLIFHFENGAGKENPPLSFTTRGREYQLTGIMTREKSQDLSVNHFITWVRDPSVNKWLDCNDLNIDIISYSPGFPDIKFQDVFIYVYESFDDMRTIIVSNVEHKKNAKANEAIPCIDISEDSDSENSNSQSSNKDTENKAVSKFNSQLQDNASFTESCRDKSENSNSQNVSECNKNTRKIEIFAFNSQMQDTSVESGKDKSDNNCSQSYAPGSNTDTKKVEISASESLQGNTSFVEPGRDKFENINSLKEHYRKMEIYASDSQLQDNATSVISDRDKSLEIRMSAGNMQTFTSGRQVTEKCFLQSLKTTATTSGTSYVKLSVRKRKSPGVPLHKKNSVNEVYNPDSVENSSMTIYSPSCSKSVKETREFKEDLDEDYVQSGVPKKKKIIRRITNAKKHVKNTKGRAHNSKAKVKVLKTGLKKSSQVKSFAKNFTSNKIPGAKKSSQINPKLKDIISKKGINDESFNSSLNSSQEEKNPEEHQLFPEQCHLNLGTASETENSDDKGIKILKDFEDDCTCHDPGCNCELANFEEEIDAGVDFMFAYFCQLSKMSENHGSQ